MTRLLAILLFLALIWLAVERASAAFRRSPQGQQILSLWRALRGLAAAPPGRAPSYRGGSEASAPPAHAGKLVRCSHCQTHILEQRSIRRDRGEGPEVFCSEDCLREAELSS